jgi:hypothetical protein
VSSLAYRLDTAAPVLKWVRVTAVRGGGASGDPAPPVSATAADKDPSFVWAGDSDVRVDVVVAWSAYEFPVEALASAGVIVTATADGSSAPAVLLQGVLDAATWTALPREGSAGVFAATLQGVVLHTSTCPHLCRVIVTLNVTDAVGLSSGVVAAGEVVVLRRLCPM